MELLGLRLKLTPTTSMFWIAKNGKNMSVCAGTMLKQSQKNRLFVIVSHRTESQFNKLEDFSKLLAMLLNRLKR